ncbi:hypothetical protein HJC23_006445 [Cyclotella cryptica]|uniref:DUF1826 domain-containing protein n=1 Tax=Cyclotella cryptica TaxID=29204 RepID=A0ABD3QUG8_9STRA
MKHLVYNSSIRQYIIHLRPLSLTMATESTEASATSACASDCSCDESSSLTVTSRRKKIKGTGNEILFVDRLSQLAEISNDNVQLVVWPTGDSNFLRALANPSIPAENLPTFEGMVPALPKLVAEIIKKHIYLPYALRSRPNVLNEEEATELSEHIDKLVQQFADVAIQSGFMDGNVDGDVDEIPFVHVKLQVMTTDGCRFWHQDSVPFRLVSTLRGPCTEWVPPEFSTTTLKRKNHDSKHAQSMKLGDVALFKGRGDVEAKSIFGHPGIVHRSPRIEGSGDARIVLVIDIPQQGWHFD